MLGRKQSLTRDNWHAAAARIDELVPVAELERLIDEAVTEVREVSKGKNVAWGWSAGKDSVALRYVLETAGVEWPSFITLTSGLEWPDFLDWVDDHEPDGLERIIVPLDYPWLRDHPHLLFPQDSRTNSQWLVRVQRKGWTQFAKTRKPDLICLGKRTQDGNNVGPKGSNMSTTKAGVTTWSPLAHWRHEHLIALFKYANLALPPVIYDNPRGFHVGTGPWAQRQGTSLDPNSPEYGWREVWDIDPSVVHQAAAERIPGARTYLERVGQ